MHRIVTVKISSDHNRETVIVLQTFRHYLKKKTLRLKQNKIFCMSIFFLVFAFSLIAYLKEHFPMHDINNR